MLQTATLRVDNTYIAKAVNGDKKLDYKGDNVYGNAYNVRVDQLLLAYQYMPFIITFIIVTAAPILLCCLCCKCKRQKEQGREGEGDQDGGAAPILCCLCCKCERQKKQGESDQDGEGQRKNKKKCLFETQMPNISQKLRNTIKDSKHQSTIVAIVTLSSCFTVYNFILDMLSVCRESTSDLPGYYERNLGIYICTIIFAWVSLSFLIIGILWFIVLLRIWSCGPMACCFRKEEVYQHIVLLIPIILCVESTILSLSFHFQNILIAWSTDPFYASRIAVYYGIVIFVYYHTFKNTYLLPIVCKREFTAQPSADSHNNVSNTAPQTMSERDGENCCNSCIEKTWGCGKEIEEEDKKERTRMRTTSCVVGLGILCVVIAGILLSGFHALNAVFIYYIPINHSIEESINGVQTIYNGAVLLIGGLIAYNIGWFYYHSKKFSVEGAMQKAMKEMKENPFGRDPNQYVEEAWDVLSEEDRMKEIMKALLIHKANKNRRRSNTPLPPPPPHPPPHTEL